MGRVEGHAPAVGEIEIRIAHDGTWFYHGMPIARKEMIALFAARLEADGAGGFWLIQPGQRLRIRVEDAPFVAVEVVQTGRGPSAAIALRTNVDEIVTVDADHPLTVTADPVTAEPAPYVTVRPGVRARLLRAVYYDLVDRSVERTRDHETVYGVWSRGQFFPLGDPIPRP